MTSILTQEEVNAFSVEEKKDSPGYSEYLGGFHFRDRMKLLAERACQLYLGDLIEVGVYSGQTSVVLAEVTKRYGRKLICVDNWKPGDPDYKYEQVEKDFHATVKDYMDVIEVWKMDAHTPEASLKLASRQYCFALSDDGHQYKDHMSELLALLPVTTGIAVADDVYYHTDVTDAMRDSVAANPQFKILMGDKLREGYMIRKEG